MQLTRFRFRYKSQALLVSLEACWVAASQLALLPQRFFSHVLFLFERLRYV